MSFSRVALLTCVAIFAAAPSFAQDDYGHSSSGNSATYAETRLTAQEEQIRTMNGRIEQIEFSMRRVEQAVQRMQADVDTRLTKMEAAQVAAQAAAAQPPVPPPAQPAAAPVVSGPAAAIAHEAPPQTPAVEPTGTLGALKMQGGKITGGVNKPQATPLPTPPADYGLTAQEQYERAFNFLRQASYGEAEQAFKGFIDKNPKDKLIDNAKYWYGETLYVRARFDDAAIAFADAYQQNPQGTKAPDSLLKLGLSLAALNKTSDACVTFNELKIKYPNAAPTVKSRVGEERTRLKCPAK